MKIWLADINKKLCDEWIRDFREYPNVSIHHGSMFEVPANTIVSPANSFGFMTGGVDYAISEYLGWHVQDKVKRLIKKNFDGELLIGQAIWVQTEHDIFPFLISSPTMRVPSLINGTINAYLATRAALRSAKNLQTTLKIMPQMSHWFYNVDIAPVFTGMGTGTGRMNPSVCSRQMLEAYEEILTAGKELPQGLRDKSLRQREMER